MPMYEEYKENKSDVATFKTPAADWQGLLPPPSFWLSLLVIPRVHLDIAGTSMSDKERNYLLKVQSRYAPR